MGKTIYRRARGIKKFGEVHEELLVNKVRGRPRIYDPEIIIDELNEWIEKETSINFVQFCAKHKYLPNLIERLNKENDNFSYAYAVAKMKLAERRERLMNSTTLNYGAFQRYQAMYDPFLKKEETDEKNADALRAKGVSESKKENFIELVKQVSSGDIIQED